MTARTLCRAFGLTFLISAACGGEPAEPSTPPAAPVSTPDSASRLVVDPPAANGAVAISVTSADGGAIATWVEPASDGLNRVVVSTFDRASRHWSAPSTVVLDADLLANSVELPTTVRTPGGVYFVTFLRRGGGEEASSIHLATSRDGSTWRLLGTVHSDSTDTEHGHVALLPETPGVRVVWLDGRATVEGGPMALRTALFNEAGERLGEEVLDERVCDCCQTAAAHTERGTVVVYRDRSEEERRDLSVVRRVDGAWTSPLDLAEDGWVLRGCPVNGPQVAASSRHLVVAWYTEGGARSRVRVAFSDDAGATFGAPLDIQGARALGRVAVEWQDDDTAIVASLEVSADSPEAHLLLRRVGRDRRVGAPLDLGSIGIESAFGAPRMVRMGSELLVAWAEAGPPRRVRAAIVAMTNLPAPTDRPLPIAALGTDSVGSEPADFSLPQLTGGERSLRSFRGRPLVLSYFATWCAPCREELEVLARISAAHGEAIQIVSISIDESEADAVARYAREHQIDHPILLDPAGGRSGAAWGVPPIPATFVLDGEGRLVYARRGSNPDLEHELHTALAGALRLHDGSGHHAH